MSKTNGQVQTVVPFRRVVPKGYHQATLRLDGTSALLMNSGAADRESETYRAYFNLGKTRNKTLEQEAQLRRLEWTLALYLDDQLGPYVPGTNIHELLRSAATKWKKGEDVKRSLVVVEYRVPIIYDGPRTIEGLWDAGFHDERLVKNAGLNGGRVLRCRPKFEQWALTSTIAYDPEDLDPDLLQMVVDRSQKYGLCDYRPQFGSFRATLSDFHAFASALNGDGMKAIDGPDQSAHKARVKRIVGSGVS